MPIIAVLVDSLLTVSLPHLQRPEVLLVPCSAGQHGISNAQTRSCSEHDVTPPAAKIMLLQR